jgi:hypothetical protein
MSCAKWLHLFVISALMGRLFRVQWAIGDMRESLQLDLVFILERNAEN